MKIRSLLLGSVAAVGLTTGGYAADLGVLTSLDVCDSLGLSGLTISSETTCLQISGSVDYRLRYGDYRGAIDVANPYDPFVDPIGPDADPVTGNNLDWDSRSRAYLQVVASSESDFGRAAAVIGFRQVDEWRTRNEGDFDAVGGVPQTIFGGDHTNGVQLEEAYVSVGDSTVIMIGKKKSGAAGSVVNVVDDAPYSFLFMSEKIDGQGVILDADDKRLGGHSIQVESDLGNGVSASIALENIDNNGAGLGDKTFAGVVPVGDDSNLQTHRPNSNTAGTLIGVLEYKGDGITAHVSGLAYGVLDGAVDAFALHAGATAVLDQVELVGAVGYDSNYKFNGYSVLHALASARVSFDMFKIAVSGEVANSGDAVAGGTDYSVGARLTAEVTDGVTFNLDGSWFHDAINANTGLPTDTARVQADVALAVTETVTLTAAVGGYFGSGVQTADQNLYYGKAGVAWAPGGDFNSAASIEINDEGGWRSEVTASKKFQ